MKNIIDAIATGIALVIMGIGVWYAYMFFLLTFWS